FVLANVFAHAHLAAVGWASMMVVGVAYRLLPMVLQSEMPRGRRLWIGCALLEAGTAGLFCGLILRSQLTWIVAVTIVGGCAGFRRQAPGPIRGPRPRPPGLVMPEPAVLPAAAAFASLLLASALGLWLAIADQSEWTLRLAMAYGVFGLVGFLAQMVVA